MDRDTATSDYLDANDLILKHKVFVIVYALCKISMNEPTSLIFLKMRKSSKGWKSTISFVARLRQIIIFAKRSGSLVHHSETNLQIFQTFISGQDFRNGKIRNQLIKWFLSISNILLTASGCRPISLASLFSENDEWNETMKIVCWDTNKRDAMKQRRCEIYDYALYFKIK